MDEEKSGDNLWWYQVNRYYLNNMIYFILFYFNLEIIFCSNYEAYQQQEDNIVNSDDPGSEAANKKTFLSSSVHGSPRHLRDLSVKGLTLVSEMGIQSLFITLTTNTEWAEVIIILFNLYRIILYYIILCYVMLYYIMLYYMFLFSLF